ncbi:MAG: 16S rRNA (cytosine(1402)-N(4))-methyltransferase RsmH [Verrucomicrobiales bacterium]|nr:16S rRNA (cytosine(1402)-N(4))-methyltransferase RsmH [Verrucomicrobiales bacterium]
MADEVGSVGGGNGVPDRNGKPVQQPNSVLGPDRGGIVEDLPFYHEPVLKREVLAALKPGFGKQFLDGTTGGGGHSELLLTAGAHVIGCDQDEEALAYATARLGRFGDQFLPVPANFADMEQVFEEIGVDRVDGILLDIGVSSHQLDEARRGFSFSKDGPLDMRMNQSAGQTAADLVNEEDEEELGRIFREYGEERSWRKAARAIVSARKKEKIETTKQLSEVIGSVIPKTSARNPATKIFQGLRIAVNDELGRLEEALEKSADYLLADGVLAVITFHSLEDRIVKQFLRRTSQPYIDRPEWPEPKLNPDYRFNLPSRKAIQPSEEEIEGNPRARSAKLRVGVRIGDQ